ncbi:HNH endonuclease signature motif containing protein, partial [Microbacterium sp.]|uniref:HNH endonuclease signature motif containing protein n=1 Tax=Microbacterium sp. TaxID=51671 RepID=UPI003C7664CB
MGGPAARRDGACDIDHRIRWVDGGTTSADNLTPACPRHHPVKDETQWGLHRDP